MSCRHDNLLWQSDPRPAAAVAARLTGGRGQERYGDAPLAVSAGTSAGCCHRTGIAAAALRWANYAAQGSRRPQQKEIRPMSFQDHFQRAFAGALAAIPAADSPDIYAISFFIYDEDDDPRRPTVTVGTTPNPG